MAMQTLLKIVVDAVCHVRGFADTRERMAPKALVRYYRGTEPLLTRRACKRTSLPSDLFAY